MENNLNVLLAKKRMTIKQLSQITGLSKNSLYAIRAENKKDLKFSTVEKLCNALECSVDELMRG